MRASSNRRSRACGYWLRTVAIAAGLTAVLCGAAALAQSTVKPVASRDAKDDVNGKLDLTRVTIGRGSDGRLRASLTLASDWTAGDLRAQEGPPGSICVKLWTVSDPPDSGPDYLVCATAKQNGDDLRASVLRERANQLPQRVASAVVSRPSVRTVTLRFSQSSIGHPAAVDVAAETTRPGCPRVSCIDTAPDTPQTLRLALRKPATGEA